ncbi:MAG TPA: hypothetical protein VJV78_44945 [Polyangiales bacterium]|nr:hypothetical protein [Polyangiales bacterium]
MLSWSSGSAAMQQSMATLELRADPSHAMVIATSCGDALSVTATLRIETMDGRLRGELSGTLRADSDSARFQGTTPLASVTGSVPDEFRGEEELSLVGTMGLELGSGLLFIERPHDARTDASTPVSRGAGSWSRVLPAYPRP